MSDLFPVGGSASSGSVNRASLNGAAQITEPKLNTAPPTLPPSVRLADRVEVSDRARYLEQLRGLPAIREDVVVAVKDAIETGDYPLDDRLNVAIDRLIDDLEV